MKILIELFIAFFKIGLFAFGGGYAVLPLINQVIVEEKGWLTVTEMTDVVSISQMTPGPIAINSSSFVGTKIAGIPGAIVATIGNVAPQLIIMMILSYFIFRGRELKLLNRALKILRPGVVGLIASAALSMIITSLFPAEINSLDFIALLGFLIGGFLIYKKVDSVLQIAIAGVIGAAIGLILSI